MARMKVVVVGGVAGGATAATRARRLDEEAEIVVLERGRYVSFANCGLPYHIGGEIADRDRLLLQTPASLKARYEIDVRVENEVLEIDRDKHEVVVRDLRADRLYRQPYDKLILSPGAAPVRPPLPGVDDQRIFTLRTVPDADRIKAALDAGARDVVVVGGGFIGLEMVENLRRRGLDVHLVELLDQVLPPLDPEMAAPLQQTLADHGVKVHLGDAVESFASGGGKLLVRLGSGTTLPADLVLLAVGVRPEGTLAASAGLRCTLRGAIMVDEHMRTSDPDIFAVGDAVVVRDFVTADEVLIPLAGPANRQGRIAADNACGRDATYRGSQGTSVVRLFDLTAASTGASEKTLRRAAVEYEKIYVHPANHVTYFPGAEQMTIKLLFQPPDGRVLGAQIVGGGGVAKRIDVMATAIQGKMTVDNLAEAELAYAPQFGAAKDPINMAGFVAANVLRGDVQIAHADQLDGALLLDVRSPAEYAAGNIPDARLIPLPELRRRYDELPTDQPIVVYCQVGLRGYLAARQLQQRGFQVRNLSGGYKTYCAYHADSAATPTAAV